MKAEFSKVIYDGQKFCDFGIYNSLESAHGGHAHYSHQQNFEDIESAGNSVPYLHIIEYRDGECYNDLFFTWKQI